MRSANDAPVTRWSALPLLAAGVLLAGLLAGALSSPTAHARMGDKEEKKDKGEKEGPKDGPKRPVSLAVLQFADRTGPLDPATVVGLGLFVRTRLAKSPLVKMPASADKDFGKATIKAIGQQLGVDYLVIGIAFDKDKDEKLPMSSVIVRIIEVNTEKPVFQDVLPFGRGDEECKKNSPKLAEEIATKLLAQVPKLRPGSGLVGPPPVGPGAGNLEAILGALRPALAAVVRDELKDLRREVSELRAALRGGGAPAAGGGGLGREVVLAVPNTVDDTGPLAPATVRDVGVRLRKELESLAGTKQAAKQVDFSSEPAGLRGVGQGLSADVVIGTVAFDEGGQSHVRMQVLEVASGKVLLNTKVEFGKGDDAAKANLPKVVGELATQARAPLAALTAAAAPAPGTPGVGGPGAATVVAGPTEASVAALPFVLEAAVDDASRTRAARWTSDLPRLLAKDGRLRVVPARRVLALKGKTAPLDAGKALGVRAVLTGKVSIDAESKKVTVDAELVEVGTDLLLWQDRFENANDATATAIANAVKARLGPARGRE